MVRWLKHVDQLIQLNNFGQVDHGWGHDSPRRELLQADRPALPAAGPALLLLVEDGAGLQEGNTLELQQRVVDGVGEQVADPLGEHDGDHDEQQELDVVRDFDHDDGQRHCQSGHAGEKGHGAQEGEGPGIHPVPAVNDALSHGNLVAVVDAENVDHCPAEEAAVESPDEQHRDDQAAGDLRTGRPAGQQEIKN